MQAEIGNLSIASRLVCIGPERRVRSNASDLELQHQLRRAGVKSS